MPREYTIIKDKISIPLLAHIPHSSTYIPPHLISSFLLNDDQFKEELLLLTDWYVDELFSGIYKAGGVSVIYNTSRLVVDPERFVDDALRTFGICLENGWKSAIERSQSYLRNLLVSLSVKLKGAFLYEIERLKRKIVNCLGQRELERYLDDFVADLRAEGVIPYG